MALPASYDFAGSGALSANFTAQEGTITRASGQGQCASDEDSSAFWNADAFDDDQYSQFTWGVNAVNGYAGPVVRASGTGGSSSNYLFLYEIGIIRIYKCVGGSYSVVGDLGGSATANDIVRIEVEGTTIRGYINGVQRGSDQSDASHASGSAGFYIFSTATRIDDWEGGNLIPPPGLGAGVSQMNLRQFPKAFMRRKS
jgi:hypothetical protein